LCVSSRANCHASISSKCSIFMFFQPLNREPLNLSSYIIFILSRSPRCYFGKLSTSLGGRNDFYLQQES
jgi:hypothetical protein